MDFCKRDVLLFLVCGGFVAYLLAAVLSAVFIVALPMPDDWCLKSEEVQTGPDSYETVCVVYKNSFEQAKHYHNRRMIGRNKVLLGIEFALWLGVTALLFHWMPKWKGVTQSAEGGNKAFLILLLAFGVGLVVPRVFALFLAVEDHQVLANMPRAPIPNARVALPPASSTRASISECPNGPRSSMMVLPSCLSMMRARNSPADRQTNGARLEADRFTLDLEKEGFI